MDDDFLDFLDEQIDEPIFLSSKNQLVEEVKVDELNETDDTGVVNNLDELDDTGVVNNLDEVVKENTVVEKTSEIVVVDNITQIHNFNTELKGVESAIMDGLHGTNNLFMDELKLLRSSMGDNISKVAENVEEQTENLGRTIRAQGRKVSNILSEMEKVSKNMKMVLDVLPRKMEENNNLMMKRVNGVISEMTEKIEGVIVKHMERLSVLVENIPIETSKHVVSGVLDSRDAIIETMVDMANNYYEVTAYVITIYFAETERIYEMTTAEMPAPETKAMRQLIMGSGLSGRSNVQKLLGERGYSLVSNVELTGDNKEFLGKIKDNRLYKMVFMKKFMSSRKLIK